MKFKGATLVKAGEIKAALDLFAENKRKADNIKKSVEGRLKQQIVQQKVLWFSRQVTKLYALQSEFYDYSDPFYGWFEFLVDSEEMKKEDADIISNVNQNKIEYYRLANLSSNGERDCYLNPEQVSFVDRFKGE